MLQVKLVPVCKIICEDSMIEYGDLMLTEAAYMIIAADGLAKPLIVRRAGSQYQLIDGTFWYQAAKVAKDLEPMRCEMVSAIVVEDAKMEAKIMAQVALSRI